MENTSLDTCLVLKKSFQKKENFQVHKLEASASEISSLQGTVSMMEQCISKENTTRLQKEAEIRLLNKNLKISKKENEKINIKLSKKDKLSKFNTRNINKGLIGRNKQMKILKNKRNIWKYSCWKYKETLWKFRTNFRNIKKKMRI